MPILVKDYTWVQSEKMINIRVPLNPVAHDKVDLFTTDTYIKANFYPFLLEIFLLHEIDSEKSKCIMKEDLILLDLLKKEPVEWETLEKELTKPEKMKLKQEILEKSQEEAKEKAEEKRIRRTKLDRFTVQQAMDIDSTQHALMDSRRDAERNNAMAALEEWRQNGGRKEICDKEDTGTTELANRKEISNIIDTGTKELDEKLNRTHIDEKINRSGVTITELSSSEDEEIDKRPPIRKPPPRKPAKAAKPAKTPVKSEYVEKKKQELGKRVLPRLRETSSLEITHTPRTFPTPTRESAQAEEQAWLKNVTMARRATGFFSEDLRPEEQDPQWCKDKGDDFFRKGNFLGAISAYTHGITLSDKLPSLYANRAATHFALGNFNKCANDCSTALDLMKPPCEGNRRSRAKCIARRAAALARLGYLNKAIDEMKAAGKLLPEDETIQKDIYDMERAWEQNPDSE